MALLPDQVRAYLHEHVWERLFVAFLGVDPEGNLMTWGGHLERYGIEGLVEGGQVGEAIPYLEGTLPLFGEPLVLPQLRTDSGNYADVHLFPGDNLDWVVLLDCTEETETRQLMQQRGNELGLLRDTHSRLLDQFLGKKVASDLAQGLLKFKEEGERRVITVLFSDVRGSTSFADATAPEQVFRTLNMYLRAMVKPILLEAGMVDKLIGDGVMAIFGMLPSTLPAPTLAVRAALQMMEDVERINRERSVDGLLPLEIGIGIATGPAVLGILGSKERRAFTAIGHHVNLAARLEGRAGPREIVIDDNTRSELVDLDIELAARSVSLKGIEGEVEVWVRRGEAQ